MIISFFEQKKLIRKKKMTTREVNVILESNDKKEIIVPVSMARHMRTIKNLIEDVEISTDPRNLTRIPLTQINIKTLIKIVDFYNHHEGDAEIVPTYSPLDRIDKFPYPWDMQFSIDLRKDPSLLKDVFLAAIYLDAVRLKDLTMRSLASLIRYQSLDADRRMFDLGDPTQIDEVIAKNPWVNDL